MWKWLHRIKGIVATIKGALQAEQLPLTPGLTLHPNPNPPGRAATPNPKSNPKPSPSP